jgi:hypothetical protein
MRITQEGLKEALLYEPDTGIFTWRRTGLGTKEGARAGTFNQGYIRITIKGKLYKAHRLAWLYMKGFHPEADINHINKINTDNRIENLVEYDSEKVRLARELAARIPYIMHLKGVCKHEGEYLAYIISNGVQSIIGSFSTAEEAGSAYKRFVE